MSFKIKACSATCHNVFLNSSAHMEPLRSIPAFLLLRTWNGVHPQVFAAMHSGNTDNIEQRTVHNFIHECIEISI